MDPRQLLLRMSDEGKGSTALRTFVPDHPVPHLHPDNSLETALHCVYEWPVVPVVHRADQNKVEGVVSLTDVLETYRQLGDAADSAADHP